MQRSCDCSHHALSGVFLCIEAVCDSEGSHAALGTSTTMTSRWFFEASKASRKWHAGSLSSHLHMLGEAPCLAYLSVSEPRYEPRDFS
jgi:hypothetical protein